MQQLDRIDRIVRLVLASGHLLGERPLNLLVLGYPGTGKTELLAQYALTTGVLYTAYTSFSRLLVNHGRDIIQGNIRHIVLPDLGILVGRGKEASMAEISALSSLIEEGILRWETHKTVFEAPTPQGVGLIAATTHEMLNRISDLGSPGFLSRFLLVSFRYSHESAQVVYQSIANQQYRDVTPRPFNIQNSHKVAGDPDIFTRLTSGDFIKTVRNPEDTYGFRTQRQLQTLMLSNALLAGRDHVTLEDLYALVDLAPYLNAKYTEI